MVDLYPYQLEHLDGLPKDIILAWDVGTGKSLSSLYHYRLHNPDGRLLVVAPASKVRTKDWERELKRAFGDNLPDATVASYERFTKDWQQFVDDELTVIFDECHFLCNATSKRSKAAQQVCRVAKQWIGLSATPLPNGWRSAEAYAIITGLVRNKTAFHSRFVITDRSRGFPLILGYREEETLKNWWRYVAEPLKRTGKLKLPSQSIGKVVEMSPKLLKEYRRVKRERITDDGEMLDSPPALFAHLRQMTTPARLNTIRSIIEETDEHVVIFYNYNVEREALHKLLTEHFKDRTVYEQSGHASVLPPREVWSTMPPSVTLAQYQSASQAIELTYASVTIYTSPSYSYSNFEQSMGRTRRNGQEKTTLFYMLNVEGSIDNDVWKALRAKKDFDDKRY